MFNTMTSCAPATTNLSITTAISFFNTMALTATHPSSSSAVVVGARIPGVILVASASFVRGKLYWHNTLRFAAVLS